MKDERKKIIIKLNPELKKELDQILENKKENSINKKYSIHDFMKECINNFTSNSTEYKLNYVIEDLNTIKEQLFFITNKFLELNYIDEE